jgi:hypothetical protein
MNARRASDPQYKYQVCARSAPHLANFCHTRVLGLRRRRLWSTPSSASPPEHVIASTALPSMLLDHFTQSTPPPPSLEHAVDLDRFVRSTPSPPAPEHVVDLDHFTDASDGVLCRCPRPRASLDSVLPLPAGNPRGTCELL